MDGFFQAWKYYGQAENNLISLEDISLENGDNSASLDRWKSWKSCEGEENTDNKIVKGSNDKEPTPTRHIFMDSFEKKLV